MPRWLLDGALVLDLTLSSTMTGLLSHDTACGERGPTQILSLAQRGDF